MVNSILLTYSVKVGTIGEQEDHLDRVVGAVEIIAHKAASVLRLAVPDNHQSTFDIRAQRFVKLHDLTALERPVIQTEQTMVADQPGVDRNMTPIEMKLRNP